MNRFGQRPRPKRSRAGNDSRKMHPRPDPTRNKHGQSTARFNPLPCPQEPSPPSAKYAPCLDSYPSSPRSVSCEHPPTHRSAPLVSEISGAAGPEGVNRWPRLTEQLALRDRPPGPCIGRQRWNHLLFAHWVVDARTVQSTLPRGLTADTFGGVAYLGIVPFFMQRVRPAWLPPLPGVSWFLELNVRSYVCDAAGRPGVWFYSLDCNQPLAVSLARRFFHLPYFHARMSARRTGETMRFESERRCSSGAPAGYTWRSGSPASLAQPGSLEFFLVERYLLFAANPAGRLFAGRVHHAPYQIATPVVAELSTTPARQAGFDLAGDPVSLLAARPVDVSIFQLRPADASVD